jgi:hypothetical protein
VAGSTIAMASAAKIFRLIDKVRSESDRDVGLTGCHDSWPGHVFDRLVAAMIVAYDAEIGREDVTRFCHETLPRQCRRGRAAHRRSPRR